MMDHSPCLISNQEVGGPLGVEQAHTIPEDLQEHSRYSLLMEGEEDAHPKTLFHPNPSLHEEYSQRDKGNYMPLCVTSFDLLKQRLKSSNLVQNEVMTWFETDDEGSGWPICCT